MRRLIAFVRLGRPQFLVGGFVLYGLGGALAVAGGAAFDPWRYAWGQLVVTATQLMTHYANDYFDLEADRANRTPTRWSGGAGSCPTARWRRRWRCARHACCWSSQPPRRRRRPDGWGRFRCCSRAAMIGLAWGYSAPPLRLCARGLGELTTALVVTLLVPLFGYDLQAGALAAPIFFAAALPCALQFAMLLAIEFPDAAGDAAVGKRTLVVRLGAMPAARLYAATTLAAFGALPFLARAGLPARVAAAPVLLAPVAIWQSVRVARGAYGDSARWGSVAFWAVALLIASAGVELAAVATLRVMASAGG